MAMAMVRGRFVPITAAVLVALSAVGCGNSSASPSTSSGSGVSGPTYTIGLLTDMSGLASSGSKSSVQGLRAGITVATKEGYKIKYVVADTGTSPAGALTAARKLVEHDHVFAVVAISLLTFSAANFLTSRGIPVLGTSQDGPEWNTAKNMFSVFGRNDNTKVTTTIGNFMKMKGVTTLGAIGYDISPLSAAAAKGSAISAESVGLKVGYLNPKFPFGSTNVQPAVLAMKSARVDGVIAYVNPNTALSLIAALRQAGVKVKVALMPTGYGADLLQGGPGATRSAQGAYFLTPFQPLELRTPATERFQQALRAVGVTGYPTYAEYSGYASVALLVRALKEAGPNPTRSALIKGLFTVSDFDAWGLLGDHKVDLRPNKTNVFGPDGCTYISTLVGSAFRPVAHADPICGSVIPGKTISVSS